MTGTVTAKYKGETRRCNISGVNTMELTIQAINKIMNNSLNSPIWAKGKIILKSGGVILHEMKEKE